MAADTLSIASIQPTQDGVRRPERLHRLAAAIQYYGYDFRKEGRPIQLSRFPDGALYCHNGHHRIAACVIAGRDHLLDGEYAIEDWTYEQYLEINWEANYLTPFDPRLETRIEELTPFRTAVAFITERGGRRAAEAFIWRHTELYKRSRVVTTFVELAALRFDPTMWEAANVPSAIEATFKALTEKGEDR
jgi:hypothetical protein